MRVVIGTVIIGLMLAALFCLVAPAHAVIFIGGEGSAADTGLLHEDTWDTSTDPEDNWDGTVDPNTDGSVNATIYQGGSGKSFKIVGGDGDEVSIYKSLAGDELETYFQFHAYWDTSTPIAVSSSTRIMEYGDFDFGTFIGFLRIYGDGDGAPNLIRLYYMTDAGQTYDSTTWTMTKDTWHKFTIRYSVASGAGANDGASQLWIDDVLTDADQTTVDNDTDTGMGWAQLGNSSGTLNGNLYIDTWEWRTDDSF